jgi:hypothetical protein
VSKGRTRRKLIRAPKSSSLFWIGVPVKHQRWIPSRALTPLKRFVSLFFIRCAVMRFSSVGQDTLA